MRGIFRGVSLIVAVLLTACGGGGGDNGGAATQAVTADLSVTAAAPAAVTVGQPFSYSVSVLNPATNPADNVVATITLSGGSVSAARTTSGSCTVTSVVSCTLGRLTAGTAVIQIDAVAVTTGNVAISAQATANTADPNPANNLDAKNTVAGIATTAIQQAIDTASPGQTIVVDPGVYVGILNFNGRDITLTSRDGPASTTLIQPSGLAAVRMGSGGTLTGFTIVAASVGVQVEGLGGSIITGNVFDPSLRGAPTIIGVYGVNAFNGATVQGNTFRNHSCSSPAIQGLFSPGVVMFTSLGNVTTYGPIDVSGNVFANNDCADITIGMLPPTAAMTITNNTSYGGLPQGQPIVPGSAVLTVGSGLTLSNTSTGGTISWQTFSIGSGGQIDLTSLVQSAGSGSVALTTTSTQSGNIYGVLTVQ